MVETEEFILSYLHNNRYAYGALRRRLGFMTTNLTMIPRFSKGQRVGFVGGEGTVRSCWTDSETWAYAVEMKLGPEPDMGRVGSETIVILHEAEIEE